MRRALAPIVLAIAIPAALWSPDGDGGELSASGGTQGRILLLRNAVPSFDRFVSDSTGEEQAFMRDHYWRMRGYSPFFDQALPWAPPAHFYQDLYAIYNERRADGEPDLSYISARPRLVLRDSAGNPLFIPFDCAEGECTQYAADIGNPEWQDDWIGRARDRFAGGYAGVHVDDVNMLMRVSNGWGEPVTPIDPRTGGPMRTMDWRRYVAEFTERIRAEFPEAEITHNSIWFAGHGDPYIQRALAAADYVELERGFVDQGVVGGSGRFGWERLLDHVDWLHDNGIALISQPYGLDETLRESELAALLLLNRGGDSIAPRLEVNPGSFWPGWNTDLGAAKGDRYAWSGLQRRDFERGVVLFNPPGGGPVDVDAPGDLADLDGVALPALGLEGGQGAVLLGSPDRPE